jgi:asparagine N-glycosylation enzyme membrane subunit Stt3
MMKAKLRKYWLTGIVALVALFLLYWTWIAYQDLQAILPVLIP